MGKRFPVITQAWLNAWEHVTPFLAFPPEVRRVIYTTNAIEAAQPPAAQSTQDQWTLPQRGRGPQADLPRRHERRAGVDENPQLDDSAARVQDPLRRPTARLNHQLPPTQLDGHPQLVSPKRSHGLSRFVRSGDEITDDAGYRLPTAGVAILLRAG
jgi:hypothetical protein